ncbi:MAG: acetyl-CoA synthetase [Candidatus Syntrophoarchaeum sp. GoM_oil]|nr:MAG: acetyl-CoA synthetase [Candidatus Syntrophoarchaeum sp. GoM_oil]
MHRWAETGRVNMAYESVDRHVKDIGGKIALHYLDDEHEEIYTFRDLSNLSNRFANLLNELGVVKEDPDNQFN